MRAVTEVFSFLEPLKQVAGVQARWVERVPGVAVDADRDEAMRRLRAVHEQVVREQAGEGRWWRAEQVHGADVALVPDAETITAPDGLPVVAGVDGLITAKAGEVLAIYVADCGAIWLADRGTGAIGLLHSGKKGTEGNILGVAVEKMQQEFGTKVEDLVVVLSPCIRPPDYEIDFAADIAKQAAEAGVGEFLDCGINTASDLERFYSYRTEKGRTGRMMALLWKEVAP